MECGITTYEVSMFLLCCCRGIKQFAAVSAILFLCGVPAYQQASPQSTRIYGPEDRDVPLPSQSIVKSNSAGPAQGILQSYLQAAGAAQWQGIQATGTLTYEGNEAPPPGQATLTIARDGLTRLDVTSSLGTTSLRIRGAAGTFQEVNEKQHRLAFRDARAGLFAYSFLLSPHLTEEPGLNLTAGTLQLDGKSLNKLSVGRPIQQIQTASRSHSDVIVTDIYFSADTNLPFKSVDLVGSLELSPEQYVRVVTYEDYRPVEGVELPFRCTETINGQRSWVLQLTSAKPQPQSDPAYFSF
jgi:hypothetical protein